MMIGIARRHGPLIAVLSAYWLTVAVLVWKSVLLNHHHLVYPLDDTYIHMAIAKNASLHGMWGITRHELTSSTSSPLWTALLTVVYWICGVGGAAPLLLNLAFGSLIVVAADQLVRRNGGRAAWTSAVLLAVVFMSALPTLTVTGMEHTLHALVTLLFMIASANVMASARPPSFAHRFWLAALSAFVTTARYEGLFAVAVIFMLLIATGKRTIAVIAAAGGLLPLLVYGLWWTFHGWYFVPNSVLLKSTVPPLTLQGIAHVLLWWRGLHALVANPHLLVLVTAALIALIVLLVRSVSDERTYLNMIFVAIALLHVEFAATRWFYRYEAYLLVVGVAVLGATAREWIPSFIRSAHCRMRPAVVAFPALLLAVVVIAPFATRSSRALRTTPQASRNIFELQYQMGLFVNQYYTGQRVAANDIGAITYLADIEVVDLYGLGSMEVARLMLADNYSQSDIDALTRERGVDIAIVYESFFEGYGGLPTTLHNAGEWVVRNNVLHGSTVVVSFYALGGAEAVVLTRNLEAFASQLPEGVTYRGLLGR
jgi:hypothetical protein